MSNERVLRNSQAAHDRAEPETDPETDPRLLDARYENKANIVEDCRRDAKLRREVIEEVWSPRNSPERIDNILDRMLTRNDPDSWVLTDLWQMLEDAMERMAAYRVAARDDE